VFRTLLSGADQASWSVNFLKQSRSAAVVMMPSRVPSSHVVIIAPATR